MYGVGGSDAISRDMNGLLYSSTFKHPSEGEFAKIKELIASDPYPNHHHHQQQLQQQEQNSLLRYRSAPSSFFDNLIDSAGGGGDDNGCEDFLDPLSSNTEPERFFTRHSSESRELLHNPTTMKQEETESIPKPNLYNNRSQLPGLPNHNSLSLGSAVNVESSFRVMNSTGSNLIRQSSSPAGSLSSLTIDNGITVMRDVGKSSSPSRLNNQINFSSGPSSCSRFMLQIAENGDESVRIGSPENGQLGNGNNTNRCYHPSNHSDSWNNSTFNSLKRNKDGDLKMFTSLDGLERQDGDSGHYTTGLVHDMSLPKTFSEMAAVEKFLQFQQESVPCKIRAKRGYATHPRSIAERVRRTRISERMRKLQELFPNMDKQTNTADMLDMAVEYIKDLQKEVQTLRDTHAQCTCSSKQKQSRTTT